MRTRRRSARRNWEGKCLAPPFDVFDAGRMAVVADPTGAAFCLWEAKKSVGSRIGGVDGTLCVADLMTLDQEAASAFYEKLFGWKIMKEDEEAAHRYYHIFNGDEFIGGIPPAAFCAPNRSAALADLCAGGDCEATAAKAKQLGARMYMPAMKIEDVGWMAVMADPQGAAFAIFQAARKDSGRRQVTHRFQLAVQKQWRAAEEQRPRVAPWPYPQAGRKP